MEASQPTSCDVCTVKVKVLLQRGDSGALYKTSTVRSDVGWF
jgi:hypothetical protein